jgi:hypothetical protein
MSAAAVPRSFAAAAAAPATTSPTHPIPTGPWTLYFHAPDDRSWAPDSYKKVHTVAAWEDLGAVLRELGTARLTNGMVFAMRGATSPLWEHHSNIRGGCYCLKVSRRSAVEVYTRYLAAAATGCATTDPTTNPVVGVTISPKKGFCIIKVWNMDGRAHKDPAEIVALHEEINTAEILYRQNLDAKM